MALSVGATVVSTSTHADVALSLATWMETTNLILEHRRFPDREAYIRIPEDIQPHLAGQDVILVTNTYPDEQIVQSILLLQSLEQITRAESRGIGTLTIAIPYYGYARQDKQFLPGESISSATLAMHFSMHCDRMAILDVHAKEPFGELGIEVLHPSLIPEISEFFNSGIEIDAVLAPDAGSVERASAAAELLKVPFTHLTKRRIDAHTVIHEPKELDVEGARVLIIDDMISTGGTIIRATQSLRDQGAIEVHAACTHGLFTAGATERLLHSLDSIVASTSLPNPVARIDAGKAIARCLLEAGPPTRER